ncbi:MAG: vitamin K epoxide reductase family protein [Micrococcales bacterium]|nr:vitamin K epoxide reductase family protein [Micrococcales bacterium]
MADPITAVLNLRQKNAWIFGFMLFSSCVSLIASFVLSYDALLLAENPNRLLNCDFSATLSCGTVGRHWAAHLFGFPNAFLGIAAEPVVITIAVASLIGVKFRRGFMFAAQVIYTIGLVFAYWLFAMAYFKIGALCPWCLLVSLSTTLVFSTLTHVNIRDGNLFLPKRLSQRLQWACRVGLDLVVVVILLGTIVSLITVKYGAGLFG